MRFVFVLVLVFFSITSCTNINFLLDENTEFDFLKKNTAVYLNGWDDPVLKEVFLWVDRRGAKLPKRAHSSWRPTHAGVCA